MARNNKGVPLWKRCKTDGCKREAHPDSGYCRQCEADWVRFAKQAAKEVPYVLRVK